MDNTANLPLVTFKKVMNISTSSESSAENTEINFNDSKVPFDNLNETSKTAESRVGLENIKSG